MSATTLVDRVYSSPIIFLLALYLICLSELILLQTPPPVSSTSHGSVIGSVLITAEEANHTEQRLPLKIGQKSETASYAILFKKESKIPFKRNRVIRVKPGEEVYFFKSLPVGEYVIFKIDREGFSALSISGLTIRFSVEPGQITYIGRLNVPFPHRLTYGTRVAISVQDNEEETAAYFKNDFDLVSVKKRLMVMN